jgi:hypothetical protein
VYAKVADKVPIPKLATRLKPDLTLMEAYQVNAQYAFHSPRPRWRYGCGLNSHSSNDSNLLLTFCLTFMIFLLSNITNINRMLLIIICVVFASQKRIAHVIYTSYSSEVIVPF